MIFRSGFLALGVVLVAGSVQARPKTAAPLTWTTVRTEHFSVLSATDAKSAQRWAADLERLRLGLEQMVSVRADRLAPVTVVIFPDEKSFQPYLWLEKGKPVQVGGYFARSESLNVIGLAKDSSPTATRRLIYHEATHWFLSAREEPLPLWLEEGVAELFSTYLADEKQFYVGDPVREHVDYLRSEGLPPLQQVVNAARQDIVYNDRDRTGKFYATAWLFVHWAVFGEDSPGSRSLQRYVAELRTTSDPAAAFATAFGGNYAEIGARLETYVKKGHYLRRIQPYAAGAVTTSAEAVSTEADVEFALGALLLTAHRADAAMLHLRAAAEREPANPRSWETIGFAELRAEHHAAALAAFDRAAELGSRIGLVWNNRAALRQEQEPTGNFVRTTDRESFAPAARDFRMAVDLDPHCRAAYTGLAGVTYAVEPADPADVMRFERGRGIFPADPALAIGRALALLRTERRAEGARELRRILEETENLPVSLRQLGENAFETENMSALSAELERLGRAGEYAEMIARIDRALAENTIGRRNCDSLRPMRREADQLRRINLGVEAFNRGQHTEAVVLFQAVLDEGPASASVRREATRLLKASAGEAQR